MRNMLESLNAVKTVLRTTSVEVVSNQLMTRNGFHRNFCMSLHQGKMKKYVLERFFIKCGK